LEGDEIQLLSVETALTVYNPDDVLLNKNIGLVESVSPAALIQMPTNGGCTLLKNSNSSPAQIGKLDVIDGA
jgi:hypothetical protein